MTEKNFLANIWVKRILSLLSVAYAGLMIFLVYTSLYYDIKITNKASFIVLVVFLSVLLGGSMLYTRKQFLTSVVGLAGLLMYLPVVVLFYSKANLILLIPLGVVSVLIFFFSGAGEGLKTIIGTIYLLLYIICILFYFLYVTIFSGHTIDVIKSQSVSKSGNYRCYVLDIEDTSKGTTKVIVEPNDYDIEYSNITFVQKGYKRVVYNVRKHNLDLNVEWSQDENGKDILSVDSQVRFKEEDAVKEGRAYSYFDKSKIKYKILNK
ncbi:MAG: hypothetical protein Q4F95_11880 [Oscillospiraceae bacterium]|nr:hypothetical protein [Oscillospiraceae bacterium]